MEDRKFGPLALFAVYSVRCFSWITSHSVKESTKGACTFISPLYVFSKVLQIQVSVRNLRNFFHTWNHRGFEDLSLPFTTSAEKLTCDFLLPFYRTLNERWATGIKIAQGALQGDCTTCASWDTIPENWDQSRVLLDTSRTLRTCITKWKTHFRNISLGIVHEVNRTCMWKFNCYRIIFLMCISLLS